MGLNDMPIKGIHVTPRPLADGTVRYHYYTRRGKGAPKFWETDNYKIDVNDKKALPADFVDAYLAAKRDEARAPDGSCEDALVFYFEKSPRFLRMGKRGQKARRDYLHTWLDMKMKNGKKARLAPIAAFDLPDLIERLMVYQESVWGHSPSTTEEAQVALSAWLGFLQRKGKLNRNIASALDSPYQRPIDQGRIWTAQEQAQFLPAAPHQIQIAFRLAALTGLRLGDLVSLPISSVRRQHIIIPTGKSGGQREAVIPLIPELRNTLDEAREFRQGFKVEALTILVNSRGKPWSADGFKTSFYKQRTKCGLGSEGPSIHDLRKTAATYWVIAQKRHPEAITDAVLMDMFAWTPGTLAKMKRIYVNDDAVITALTGGQK